MPEVLFFEKRSHESVIFEWQSRDSEAQHTDEKIKKYKKDFFLGALCLTVAALLLKNRGFKALPLKK